MSEQAVTEVATAIVDSSLRTIAGSNSRPQYVARELELNLSRYGKSCAELSTLSIQYQLFTTTPAQRF